MSVQTQELFSNVCGQYCIFYMFLRARDHSIDVIVHVFCKVILWCIILD